ncbi:MAG: MFS transporter [Candidatus Micrarchaeaceae archaeon]
MLSIIPANIAYGPLSILITLYILKLGGGILDVSYAITLSGMISIPAVFLWGFVTDLVNKRKALIVFPYFLTGVLIAGLLFIKNIYGIIVLYAVISFVNAATGAPINLLIMENGKKSIWTHNFSLLQTLASLGATVGYVIAWIITGVASLGILIIVLAISSVVSAFIAQGTISDPGSLEKGVSINKSMNYFLYRLVGIPHMVVRIPNPMNIKKWFEFRNIASDKRGLVIAFYAISFIFFFGSSIFNTEYPVGLRLGGLTESAIFFIVFSTMVIQTLTFYYYDNFTRNLNIKAASWLALLLRGSSYVLIGVVFVGLKGFDFFTGNFLFYIMASGVAYAIYYPTSYAILFKTLGSKGRGSAIGIYSSLIGIGTFTGSLVSGGLAVTYGFGLTFVVGGVLMLACSIMYRRLSDV